MARIEYKNDVTRALEEAEGSDGRMNVSSRTDGRSYYISRDQGQTYSMTFDHPAAVSGQYSAYVQNTSTNLTMVVSSIGLNTTTDPSRFKLWVVTGTATEGAAVIPHNLNESSNNDATGTFLHDNGATAITTIAVSGIELDDVQVSAYGHEELRLLDRVRLGQNDAIAIECDATANAPSVFGVIFFYYE